MRTDETYYAWGTQPRVAWALVCLFTSDSDNKWLSPYVHGTREAAESFPTADGMNTLYRVCRSSLLVDATATAPVGIDYAFVCSSPGGVWSKISFGEEIGRPDDPWTFCEARDAVERVRQANEDNAQYGCEQTFRAYLLTWSVVELSKRKEQL